MKYEGLFPGKVEQGRIRRSATVLDSLLIAVLKVSIQAVGTAHVCSQSRLS